jgi:hypothetical protein
MTAVPASARVWRARTSTLKSAATQAPATSVSPIASAAAAGHNQSSTRCHRVAKNNAEPMGASTAEAWAPSGVPKCA